MASTYNIVKIKTLNFDLNTNLDIQTKLARNFIVEIELKLSRSTSQSSELNLVTKLIPNLIKVLIKVGSFQKLAKVSIDHHLSGEADKLECLVLAPRGHDVGEGAVDVLVQWHGVSRLSRRGDVHCRQSEGEDPVHKHQELRVLEMSSLSFRVYVLLEQQGNF